MYFVLLPDTYYLFIVELQPSLAAENLVPDGSCYTVSGHDDLLNNITRNLLHSCNFWTRIMCNRFVSNTMILYVGVHNKIKIKASFASAQCE